MTEQQEKPNAPASAQVTYTYEGPDMKGHVEALTTKRDEYLGMGGPDRVERQRSQNKLTVRERIDLLFDLDTFEERGLLAHHQSQSPTMQGKFTPADGVVTGIGKVDGRPVAVIAYDFTVMAGSMGMVTEIKATRMRELALRERIPLVWLIDSAGARIQEATGSMFARTGDLFREQVIMSGVVPQVAAMMGPGAAGTAYIPGLADFVPMVKGNSNMALAGPHLVKAAVGEEVTAEEMGGSKVHCKISGVADLEVEDDEKCIEAVRKYLSFFPSSNLTESPITDVKDPVERHGEELYDIVPANPRQAYDMHKVIASIVDDADFFPMKPDWARNVITGFARFGGRAVGIVANQPKFLGGALDVNSADKAARFVWLCDAFHIPLVFLMDCPGFLVGSAVEKQGIIRHGAKMLFAVSEATVPKVTVVLRKGYGAGYYVMNGRAFEPDLIVGWPTAEISVMGPEGAVNIIFRKQIEAMPEEEQVEARNNMVSLIRDQISPYVAAGWAFIDDVIDPADTRTSDRACIGGGLYEEDGAALAQARSVACMNRDLPYERIVRRLRVMGLLALAVLAYGTVGYVLVEGWTVMDGLYMTLITLTTVGFTEVHPMDDAGRLFTMSLLVMGVGLIAVTLSLAAQLIQEGALGDRGRRRRMSKKIEDLSNHYIVCAYGRVGRTVSRQLEAEGVDFLVIDRLEELEDQLAQDGVTYMIANPSDETALRAAGITRARGLVSAVDDDGDSVFVTLAARALNPDIYVVARASTESAARALYNAGANRVISPYVNSGRDMAHQVLHRHVIDAIDITPEGMAPILVEELEVEKGSNLIDAQLGHAIGHAIALAVRRSDGEVITNPAPDLTLQEGDLLVLLGDREALRPLEGD